MTGFVTNALSFTNSFVGTSNEPVGKDHYDSESWSKYQWPKATHVTDNSGDYLKRSHLCKSEGKKDLEGASALLGNTSEPFGQTVRRQSSNWIDI